MEKPITRELAAQIRQLALLRNLTPAQLDTVLAKLVVRTATAGADLFTAGARDGAHLYLIAGEVGLLSDQGEVQVVSANSDTARYPIADSQPRQLTARANSDVTYILVERKLLDDALRHTRPYEVEEVDTEEAGDWMTQLLASRVFQNIPPGNIQRVMLQMEPVDVTAGTVILREGEEGDYFYLLGRGQCRITRQQPGETEPTELACIGPGTCFGEEALLTNSPRNSTATMITDGQVVRLAKEQFINLVKRPLTISVSLAQAQEEIAKGAVWLDVRTPTDYRARHIKKSFNLPLGILRLHIQKLPKDRTFIVCADDPGQAVGGAYRLVDQGLKAVVLSTAVRKLAPELLAGELVHEPAEAADEKSLLARPAAELTKHIAELEERLYRQTRRTEELEQQVRELQRTHEITIRAKEVEKARLTRALEETQKTQTQAPGNPQAELQWREREAALMAELDQERDIAAEAEQERDEALAQLNALRDLRANRDEVSLLETGRLKEDITVLTIQLEDALAELERVTAERDRLAAGGG